ncbi:MAG: hypothetical protein AB7O52_05460 [Planctomycetota bacterium]
MDTKRLTQSVGIDKEWRGAARSSENGSIAARPNGECLETIAAGSAW